MQVEAHATRSDDLYPRWYLALRGFVWGLIVGLAGASLLYEAGVWRIGNVWRLQLMPMLLKLVPLLFLAIFEVVFRVRRHLRLQRRIDASVTEP